MQYLIEIGEIKQRAAAIGLSLGALAVLAKVDPSTAYRGAKGDSDHRVTTLGKLSRALLAKEELRRRELNNRRRRFAGAAP